MSNRWIGVALVAWCLAQTSARAQFGEGCPPQLVPGPMSPEQAPPGPGGDCMSLPANIPNAFSEECVDPCPRVWLSADYIYWALKSPRLSTTLVTTNQNPPVGNNLPTGLLGQPGTIEVLRVNSLKYSPVSGGRLFAGFWFDTHQCVGLEAGAFVTQTRSTSYKAASDGAGNPLIFVPFYDNQGAGTGTGPGEFGFADSIPGFRTGAVAVTSSTSLWGAEVNLTNRVAQCCGVGATLIAGFRYVDLQEDVAIGQNSTAIDDSAVAFGVPFGANTTLVTDRFRGRNQFYGGQVGVRAAASWRQLFFGFQGKIAIGDMHEVVTVTGESTLANPTATSGAAAAPIPPTTIAVGRFAAPSNIGRHFSDRFAIVPECEGRVGIHICDGVDAYVGYTFLYMSKVARAGDQIDRRIDLTQIPTAFEYNPGVPGQLPRVPFTQSYFWAQGIDVGMEFSY